MRHWSEGRDGIAPFPSNASHVYETLTKETDLIPRPRRKEIKHGGCSLRKRFSRCAVAFCRSGRDGNVSSKRADRATFRTQHSIPWLNFCASKRSQDLRYFQEHRATNVECAKNRAKDDRLTYPLCVRGSRRTSRTSPPDRRGGKHNGIARVRITRLSRVCSRPPRIDTFSSADVNGIHASIHPKKKKKKRESDGPWRDDEQKG